MYYELIVKICNYMWIGPMLCIVWSDYELVMIPVLFLFLQIRQEKPYYVADPEVDSLVSIVSNPCPYIFMKIVCILRKSFNRILFKYY